MNLEEKTKAELLKEQIHTIIRRIPSMSEQESKLSYILLREKSVEYRKLTGEYYQNWR